MSNEIKIERKAFFEGISTILSTFEPQDFKCNETPKVVSWGIDEGFRDNPSNDWGSYRHNKIEILGPEGVLFDYKTFSGHISGEGKVTIVEQFDMDKFIDFSEANNLLLEKKLYDKYPYLVDFILSIKNIAVKNNGILTQKDILGLIKTYINESTDIDKKVTLLNRLLVKAMDTIGSNKIS